MRWDLACFAFLLVNENEARRGGGSRGGGGNRGSSNRGSSNRGTSNWGSRFIFFNLRILNEIGRSVD